jgi:hypothetical protein
LFLLACGGGGPKSQLQTCKDTCSFQKSCTIGATDADVKACQATCDQNKATLDGDDASLKAQCKNSSDILNGIHECYTEDCDTTVAQSCAQTFVNSCEPK